MFDVITSGRHEVGHYKMRVVNRAEWEKTYPSAAFSTPFNCGIAPVSEREINPSLR